MGRKDVNGTLMSTVHSNTNRGGPERGGVTYMQCMKWAEGVNKGLQEKATLSLGFGDGMDFTRWRIMWKVIPGQRGNVHKLKETSRCAVCLAVRCH